MTSMILLFRNEVKINDILTRILIRIFDLYISDLENLIKKLVTLTTQLSFEHIFKLLFHKVFQTCVHLNSETL